MRQTTGTRKSPGEKLVKDIKRATRKQWGKPPIRPHTEMCIETRQIETAALAGRRRD